MTCPRSPQINEYSKILKSIGFQAYALFSFGQEYAKLVYVNFRAAYAKLVRCNFGKLVTSNKIIGSEKQFNTLKHQRAKVPRSVRHIALHSGTVLARHRVTALFHHRGTTSPHESDPPPPLHPDPESHPENIPRIHQTIFFRKRFSRGRGYRKNRHRKFPHLSFN